MLLHLLPSTTFATIVTTIASGMLLTHSVSALVINGVTAPITAGDELTSAVLASNSGTTIVGDTSFLDNTNNPQQETCNDFTLTLSIIEPPVLTLPGRRYLQRRRVHRRPDGDNG